MPLVVFKRIILKKWSSVRSSKVNIVTGETRTTVIEKKVIINDAGRIYPAHFEIKKIIKIVFLTKKNHTFYLLGFWNGTFVLEDLVADILLLNIQD